MKITVVGAFTMTEALRWPCESAPSSPITSPDPSSVTREPSRTTSSAPSRIAKNSNANRPSCSSCSPGATSISSAQSATRRNSCLSRSAKTGIDLSRAGFNVPRSSHSTRGTRARTLALVQPRDVLAGCGRSAGAARAAVALEDVERLVQVDLDLAAVGLRDRHLVAVAAEVGRDIAGGAAAADALLSSRLRLGRSLAGHRLLRVLVRRAAVRWEGRLRLGGRAARRRGSRRIGGAGDRRAAECKRAESPDAEHRLLRTVEHVLSPLSGPG